MQYDQKGRRDAIRQTDSGMRDSCLANARRENDHSGYNRLLKVRMEDDFAILVREFPTLRNVAVRLAIYHAYGILVPDKAGPEN